MEWSNSNDSTNYFATKLASLANIQRLSTVKFCKMLKKKKEKIKRDSGLHWATAFPRCLSTPVKGQLSKLWGRGNEP